MTDNGARACDTCGATDVLLEKVGRFCQCARCKVRSQSYVRGRSSDRGSRDALIKSAEAMFRAMCDRGLRAVEILEAAGAVGEKPITEFLVLAERGDAESALTTAERELTEDAQLAEDAHGARREAAERYAELQNNASAQSSYWINS